MTGFAMPPSLIFIVAAIVLAIAPRIVGNTVMVLAPLLAALAAGLLTEGFSVQVGFMKYSVTLVQAYGQGTHIVWVICLSALIASLFCLTQDHLRRYAVAGLLAAGFGVGVVLSGDLIAIFLQWELMVLALTALIFMGGSDQSRSAGIRFLLLQLLGSFIFKYGMHGYYQTFESYVLSAANLPVIDIAGGWALLVGALIKLGAWPVAVFMPDAARHAGPRAALWLGIALPISAIAVMERLFNPWPEAMLTIGVLMLAYALIYGLLSHSPSARMARVGIGCTAVAVIFLATDHAAWGGAFMLLIPIVYALGFGRLGGQVPELAQHSADARADLFPDADWIWRHAGWRIGQSLVQIGFLAKDLIVQTAAATIGSIAGVGRIWMGFNGLLARTWGIGQTAIWVLGLLALYGLVYLVL